MIVPTKNKILCEVVLRERKLPSGLWLTDRIKNEKKDNVARCIGVGKDIKGVRRTDLVHFKAPFARRLTYNGKNLLVLKEDEVIAIERDGEVKAVGNMVIAKLEYSKKIGSIIVPDNAKQNSGDFIGKVVSCGPDYPVDLPKDTSLVFLRNEGYRFKTYDTREELIAIKERWCYAIM